jgi:GNAT superfamily N-acetyltransferase
MNYHIELATDPQVREEQDRFIRDGIIKFNARFGVSKREHYSIYVKDNASKIIGGAIVYAHTSSIYIDILWVSEEYRGCGIGSELLLRVEAEAIKRGIKASTLDTFSFQAENFYLKQGYEHLGTIKNYVEGHDRIYFRKRL